MFRNVPCSRFYRRPIKMDHMELLTQGPQRLQAPGTQNMGSERDNVTHDDKLNNACNNF